ncbi:protein-tyrosine phosphatase family protein [Roseococcus sp.]|uniref:protein-tyrosine phosphatase family protein n=1 Tax=Roseococcus sp. TaxID=2109646 RepID=UPI003BACF0DD
MTLRPVALAEVPGGLWLSAMPGRAAPLGDFLAATAAAKIGQVLCLAGDAEIAAKAPDYAALLASGDLPWIWRAHPIEDFGVPEDAAGFVACIAQTAALLRQGERIVLHCAAGIGRTGMAAQCLLLTLGLDRAEALARVTAAGSHPETARQRAFIGLV